MKDNFLREPMEIISNFKGVEKTQEKSSFVRFLFVKFEAFGVCFLRLKEESFLRSFFHRAYCI